MSSSESEIILKIPVSLIPPQHISIHPWACKLSNPSTPAGSQLNVSIWASSASAVGASAVLVQRRVAVEVLVTTPESLALQLSYEDAESRFRGLDGIVVDEWHELLGSKRGVLLELGLARLRQIAPTTPIWVCRRRSAIWRKRCWRC